MVVMELHKEIAVWLSKFRLINESNPALQPKAKIQDLVTVIRDGVVLCQLVHSLSPGCVDMTRVIYESSDGRTVSDYVCRNNIFVFIRAIVSHFEVPTDLAFDPEDLYLCRDLGKVFKCLSVLSHAPNFVKSGVSGFPKKEKQLEHRIQVEQSHYQELNELYGNAGTEYVFESFAAPTRTADSLYEKYEGIYQTLFPPKAPRLSLNVAATPGAKRKKKRQRPLDELISTEDKYLENLIMVRDKFREPLSRYLSVNERRIVFCHLDELIVLHSDILFEIKQKKADVGLVFLKHMTRITTLYGNYCVNLPVAMDMIEKLPLNNAALKKQLADCQAVANPPTFPLSAHIVIPFQRFLKYHLLLKEILKYTDEDLYGGGAFINLSKVRPLHT